MYLCRISFAIYLSSLVVFNGILFASATSTAAAAEVVTDPSSTQSPDTMPPDTVSTDTVSTDTVSTDTVSTDTVSPDTVSSNTTSQDTVSQDNTTTVPDSTESSTTVEATTAGAFSIECEPNTCPEVFGEIPKCFKRQARDGSEFVCECPNVRGANFGFTCEDKYYRDFQNSKPLSTCYGLECKTGSVSSRGFPSKYNERRGGDMTLVYVPGAFRFDLSFDETFMIELFKDDLVVGYGLSPPFDEVPGDLSDKKNLQDARYFNGYTTPPDFSIIGDTMWIWFGYDNSIAFEGFNLSWTARTIEIECPSRPLRRSLPDDSDRLIVERIFPNTQHGVADEYITIDYTIDSEMVSMDANLTQGEYDIYYRVSDNFGSAASCSYTLIVEDTSPPDVIFCPGNYDLFEICAAQDANLTEPMAIDNVDGEVVADLRSGPLGEGANQIVYAFTDSSDNTAFCRVTVGIYCQPPTRPPETQFPLWAVFVGAAVAVAILLLILAVFANAKLSAIRAAHQADLSFNPEEYTGHKPGAPLEEAPPPPGQEKMGMYEIHA